MFIENTKNWFTKMVEYVIYGCIAIFPFVVMRSFLYDGTSSRFFLLALVSGLIAVGFGCYLVFNKNTKVSMYRSPILMVLGIYLGYLFISAIMGVDFQASFWSRSERTSGIFYLTHLIPFLLMVIHIITDTVSRERFLKVLFVSSGLYSVMTLFGNQGFGIFFTSNVSDGFTFGNSSFAAMYLLGVFLLAVYFVFRKPFKEIRWFEYLIPLVFIANPFFINIKGFSRGFSGITDILGAAQASSIALVVSVGLLLGIWLLSKIQNKKQRLITGFSVGALLLIGLGWMMGSLLSSDGLVRKAYEQKSTLARPLVWEIAKASIQERPITGWGGDNFTVAFQENFDNRLLEDYYGNEPWFDRAHNIVLDQTVDGGYIGIVLYFAIYVIIFACLGYTIVYARSREDGVLGSVLTVYFFAHLLELQTAFDTTISLVMVMAMLAFSVALFEKVRKEQVGDRSIVLGTIGKYILAIVWIGYFGWALVSGTIPFWKVQQINGQIRVAGSSEKRIDLYPALFKTKIDKAGILWKTSTDFQRGIAENPTILANPKKVALLKEEVGVLTKGYEDYVAKNPEQFRPRLGLADLYIYQMLFEDNKLDAADKMLDDAIMINSKYPQPYQMKAVTALYRRDFKNARMYADKAVAINPNAKESQRLKKYIEDSIKTFPEIELYFFTQI